MDELSGSAAIETRSPTGDAGHLKVQSGGCPQAWHTCWTCLVEPQLAGLHTRKPLFTPDRVCFFGHSSRRIQRAGPLSDHQSARIPAKRRPFRTSAYYYEFMGPHSSA